MAFHRIPAPPRPKQLSDYEVFSNAFPGFVDHIPRARSLRDNQFRKLSAAPARARHGLVRYLLKQKGLYQLYAYEALRACGQLREATFATVQQLAEQCDPFNPVIEPVETQYIRKRGRTRIVAKFGPLKRMHQMLVGDILRHLHPPLENQKLFQGGVPAAIAAVEAAFRAGFTYGAEADFTAFYAGVRLDGLADLLRPMPESVTHHVIWDIASRTADDMADPIAWASRSLNHQPGLALGAHSSPIVAERIIGSLLPSSDHFRTVTYADNIFVLGRTPEAVAACFDAIGERCSRFAGWRLRPTMSRPRDLAGGFDFLHHSATYHSGEFAWAPDQRKQNEHLAMHSDDLELRDIAALEDKIAHWRRAYPRWPEGDAKEAEILAACAARRFYKLSTPLHRTAAVQALIHSYLAYGRARYFRELLPDGSSRMDEEKRDVLAAEAAKRLAIMDQRAAPNVALSLRSVLAPGEAVHEGTGH